jgi:hypothetical protein
MLIGIFPYSSWLNLVAFMVKGLLCNGVESISCNVLEYTMKKGVFDNWAYNLVLSCNDHLQLTIFLHPWVLSNNLHELQDMQFTKYTII